MLFQLSAVSLLVLKRSTQQFAALEPVAINCAPVLPGGSADAHFPATGTVPGVSIARRMQSSSSLI